MTIPTEEYVKERKAWLEALRDNVAAWFQSTSSPRVLEIGCGHGHFLAAYAEQHPGDACLGIDLVNHRLRLCEKKKIKRSLQNLSFLKAKAEDFLQVLPSDTFFNRVFILYPDPWPKQRHAKHRLMQESFLQAMANHMAPGSLLFFRTDQAPYFQWTLEKIQAIPCFGHPQINTSWPFETTTYFQELLQDAHSLTVCRMG